MSLISSSETWVGPIGLTQTPEPGGTEVAAMGGTIRDARCGAAHLALTRTATPEKECLMRMLAVVSKFASQRRSLRIIEVSTAAAAIAIGVFGAALLLAPRITEADTIASINPEQLTINAARDMSPLEDSFQRHTGVLDKLDGSVWRPSK
jgi:hypothetical protein